MFKKIKCVLIGLGNQGCEHLSASFEHPDVEIIAAIEPNTYIWDDICVRYPWVKLTYFKDLKALKDSGLAVDAFILALPHHAYHLIWDELIAYGKPLLKEKPLGRDYQEAKMFMHTAKQANCGLQTAIQRRSHCSYLFLAELLKQKQLKISEIHAHLHLGKTPRLVETVEETKNWRSERLTAGGGALLDAGYHLIDLIQFYIGDFHVISATMWQGERADNGIDIEDRCWLIGCSSYTWLMLDTWVQGEKNSQGHYEKSEAIVLKTQQGVFKANREGVWHNGVKIYSSERDWQKAMQKQLTDFAHHIHCQDWYDDQIIDQLPAMRKIEEAYRLSSRY